MHIDMTAEESAVVAEILDSALGELREQIYKAEVAEYKARLREREALVSGVLARLGTKTSTS